MNFEIAIPTYRRSDVAFKFTLGYLRDCPGLDWARVTLFVSDDEDFVNYSMACEAAGIKPQIVVTHAASLREKFNFIHRHYAPGARVVLFEDDIKQLSIKAGEKKLERWTNIVAEFEGAFSLCEWKGARLFGVCPFANAFYMKEAVSYNLKFIVANCFGFIATGDPAREITLDAKSDYERTLLYYIHDSAVVRLNYVCVVTNNYTTAGGLQTELADGRRLEAERAACDYLTRRYPHLIQINAKREKTSRYPELTIRQVKEQGQDWHALQREHDARLATPDSL